ncbi:MULTISPECIES: glycosyltransferase [unclassified Prochlorococcus]|uniref:glycosyltransferase n=1 Tax=unclassified Prochlorococcus TaxID=2627481 RepID=UPI00097CD16F|nr:MULTISPECIES: glycosyltransferase [unclassified Prochlorococcus]AQL29773.1 glycosyl transferase family 1 [Prochlorococcus sp. RS50]AQL31596.1 glycosyl transferase family 1 [Prochlorococcus sp. RS01]AQL34548.1 glycosyl transferase family 1 [Prochlorococcus sp. RS04]
MKTIYRGNVALIHDWFAGEFYGGAEKVFKEIEEIILETKANYDIFSLVNHLEKNQHLNSKKVINTSFIQNLPFSKKHFHKYLPLFPLAIEQFDLREYDLVISSSHAVAKGVITCPDQLHISYIHSPMRYAWDQMNTYLKDSSYKKLGINPLLRLILQDLRKWDYLSSVRIDKLVSNSNFTAKRIKKYWGRNSLVIHPPVNIKKFCPKQSRDDFYLSVSRLVPNKRIDLLVKAFNKLDLRLVIVGEGPEKKQLMKIAQGNISFLNYQDDLAVKQLMEKCRAFVYAGTEDFGIAPVEAMAAGAPIIALKKAGILDTVNCINSTNIIPTGVLFNNQCDTDLRDCIKFFEDKKLWLEFSSQDINLWAQNFSIETFKNKFSNLIDKSLTEFK